MPTEQDVNDLRAELEEVRSMVIELQNRVGYVESDARRAAELAQNAEYMASDAKSAADDARNTAQRGW